MRNCKCNCNIDTLGPRWRQTRDRECMQAGLPTCRQALIRSRSGTLQGLLHWLAAAQKGESPQTEHVHLSAPAQLLLMGCKAMDRCDQKEERIVSS